MADFFLDGDGVRNGTGKIRPAGENLSSAFDNLISVLDEKNGCWGSDKFGEAFAKDYVPAEQDLRDAGNPGETAITLADSMNKSVTDFESVDEDSASKMDSMFDPNAPA